ncbi:hypothetical protein D3C79_607460 [compost metagenome]
MNEVNCTTAIYLPKRCNALCLLCPTYSRQDLIDCDSNLTPSIWIGITNTVCWRAGMPIFAALIPLMALPTLSAAIGSGSMKGWGKRNGITCMSGLVNNWWVSWNFAAFPMNPRPAMCSLSICSPSIVAPAWPQSCRHISASSCWGRVANGRCYPLVVPICGR